MGKKVNFQIKKNELYSATGCALTLNYAIMLSLLTQNGEDNHDARPCDN